MLGGKGGSQVASKGSEMWKELSEKERKVYEDRAKKEKEEYDAYIQTPEGAAALKAYKEATAAVAYKEKVPEAEEDPKIVAQKRKAAPEDAEPGAKKIKAMKAGA